MITFEQPVSGARRNVNLMQASTLGAEIRLICAAKSLEIQNQTSRIVEVARKITLRDEVSAHADQRRPNLGGQLVNAFAIPRLVLAEAASS